MALGLAWFQRVSIFIGFTREKIMSAHPFFAVGHPYISIQFSQVCINYGLKIITKTIPSLSICNAPAFCFAFFTISQCTQGCSSINGSAFEHQSASPCSMRHRQQTKPNTLFPSSLLTPTQNAFIHPKILMNRYVCGVFHKSKCTMVTYNKSMPTKQTVAPVSKFIFIRPSYQDAFKYQAEQNI